MKAHLTDTHLLLPRSRSSAKVKVKYQGHVSQKMFLGALVFHKHILFYTVKSYIFDYSNTFLESSKFKRFVEGKSKMAQMMEIACRKIENIVEKEENAGLLKCILFPQGIPAQEK